MQGSTKESPLTDVENWHCEFDMTKMSRTLEHIFSAGAASNGTVDGSKLGVVEALFARSVPLLVHGLGILDVTDAHILNLLGRKETKLDLLNRLQRSAGIGKGVDIHLDG